MGEHEPQNHRRPKKKITWVDDEKTKRRPADDDEAVGSENDDNRQVARGDENEQAVGESSPSRHERDTISFQSLPFYVYLVFACLSALIVGLTVCVGLMAIALNEDSKINFDDEPTFSPPTFPNKSRDPCDAKSDDGVWNLLEVHNPPGWENDEAYGVTVAMAADNAAVYAIGATRTGQDNTGLVEILDDTTTTRFFGAVPHESLGWDVAVSADGTVVAAAGPNVIRIYRRQHGDDIWMELTTQKGPIERMRNNRVSVGSGGGLGLNRDGTRLIVGESTMPNIDTSLIGQVSIYSLTFTGKGRHSSLSYRLEQTLQGQAANELFGSSVAISNDGTTIAVGATGVFVDRGRVRTYRQNSDNEGAWEPFGGDLNGVQTNDRFGKRVVLSADGSILVASAATRSRSKPSYVQAFKLQQNDDGSMMWNQVGSTIFGQRLGSFGSSLGLTSDGHRLVVGDSLAQDNTGEFMAYELGCDDDQEWSQLGNTIVGDVKDRAFGRVDIGITSSAAGSLRIVAGGPGRNDRGIPSQAKLFEF